MKDGVDLYQPARTADSICRAQSPSFVRKALNHVVPGRDGSYCMNRMTAIKATGTKPTLTIPNSISRSSLILLT
jgi:hypothetical protein